MARIDHAWSKELGCILTAYEAYEKHEFGELSKKTQFECIDPNCNAQITCANMDKPRDKMKVRMYFKAYGIHSDKCDEVKKIASIIGGKMKQRNVEAPIVSDKITFNFERPKNHSEVKQTVEEKNGFLNLTISNSSSAKNIAKKMLAKRRSQIYLLGTLVNWYLMACKDGTENLISIEVAFDKKHKPYTYKMGSLFKEIRNTEYSRNSALYEKIYYGKATINKLSDNEYWINYIDSFSGNSKQVRCAIKAEIIEKTNSRRGAISDLERYMEKGEIYCFAMGKLRETEKIIFINICSLDHIAFTDEDIERFEDIEDEDV